MCTKDEPCGDIFCEFEFYRKKTIIPDTLVKKVCVQKELQRMVGVMRSFAAGKPIWHKHRIGPDSCWAECRVPLWNWGITDYTDICPEERKEWWLVFYTPHNKARTLVADSEEYARTIFKNILSPHYGNAVDSFEDAVNKKLIIRVVEKDNK